MIDTEEVIFLLGLGLTATGLWLFSPAISLTISGVIFMWVGYARAGGEES